MRTTRGGRSGAAVVALWWCGAVLAAEPSLSLGGRDWAVRKPDEVRALTRDNEDPPGAGDR